MTGDLRIDAEREDGLILVTGAGFWTLRLIDRHFAELRAVMAARRAQGRPIGVLVDLRQADVQTVEVIRRIGLRTGQLYAPRDAVAFVVASCLAKIQMQRGVRRLRHGFFISMEAALFWLRAECAERPPAGVRRRPPRNPASG